MNQRARQLRRDATEAEQRLWSLLRDRRLAGYKFRRQYPVEGYIVDFACLTHKVVVEADGGQHTTEADAIRTCVLEAAGWRLIRFWNNDILANTEGVFHVLDTALESHP